MYILYLFEAVYIIHVLSLGKEGLECDVLEDLVRTLGCLGGCGGEATVSWMMW